MKNTIILLIILLSLFSCRKRDTINHYLTKPVTQQELIDNGFYKYSYTYTIDDKDKVDDTIRSIVKYDMYSNVKSERNKEGKLCPTQLWNFYNEDSIKEKKNAYYLKNKLDSRVITYLFRNDSLFYKNIHVEVFDNKHKEIVDFTSRGKIIKYYDSLKISIKPVIKNSKTGEIYPGQFMIDNYKTRFYFSEKEKYYEMFTNYLTNSTYYNVREYWYSGHISEMHYLL
ncbi:hypothetical protein [Flavobacterium sp. PL02]|uniref:hypothetical protein n=1 Tax=Flavobacterium sp. PL02 TaxID=3088354 RepID=UPI002B23EC00|nr:hypothetical protein [Flavobacterium sp. PL02]MEA9412501.1 hypothetical protein [Flavobacterium sp. PL02]